MIPVLTMGVSEYEAAYEVDSYKVAVSFADSEMEPLQGGAGPPATSFQALHIQTAAGTGPLHL